MNSQNLPSTNGSPQLQLSYNVIISERQHLCSHRGRQRVRRSVAGADEVRQVGGHPREEQGTFKTSFRFTPNFDEFIVKS